MKQSKSKIPRQQQSSVKPKKRKMRTSDSKFFKKPKNLIEKKPISNLYKLDESGLKITKANMMFKKI